MNRSPLSATSPVSALASRRARWAAPWLGAACLLVIGSPHLAAQAWESCLEDAVVEGDTGAGGERQEEGEASWARGTPDG